LSAPHIFKTPELHDAADRAVAGRIDIWEFQVMHPPIDAVDDGESCPVKFIVEPAGDETTDYRLTMALTFERPG
jgi:hypothetical protein